MGPGAETRSYQLFLEDTPVIAPNAPISKRLLEDFNGTFLEGFAQLTSQELSRMDSGICFFEITDAASGKVLLRANMKQVRSAPTKLDIDYLCRLHRSGKLKIPVF